MTKWCATCHQSHSSQRVEQENMSAKNIYFQEKAQSFGSSSGSDQMEVIVNNPQQQLVYNEVKKISVLYLEKYLSEAGQTQLDQTAMEQFIWVYRLLLLPNPLLSLLLFQHGERQAKLNYRRLCILSHPDKNVHPLAAKAFQKLLNCFNMGA